jgi:inner membrane protein
MKLPEHVTASFLLAQLGVQERYGPAGTLLMVAAGLLPDLDGLTILAGWRTYRTYHRTLGHGLVVTALGPLLLAAASGLEPFLPLWAWLQASLVLHVFTDVCFYRWPVQLLWPLSRRGWGFGLVGWNDLVPTLALYGASVAVLVWPAHGVAFATVGIAALFYYLAWRAWRPPSRGGLSAWLAGGWAAEWPRFWRWLTGDFVT